MFPETEYDSIRPYNDNEVAGVINKLLSEESFIKFTQKLLPAYSKEMIISQLSKVKTVEDFQINFIVKIAKYIIDNTTKGVTIDGLENLNSDESYLFISDHRDIVLDSALLNVLLVENGFKTTEIAIGSNLLIQPWIEDFVKLNKSFVVKRNASIRKMIANARELSAYIRYSLNDKKSSIWLAQREGRTKDGNDRTQHSLLKMLQMNMNKDFVGNFSKLKIVPVAISYEYEPCDYMKTKELYLRSTDEGFTKKPIDDLRSMVNGMVNEKGRVHFNIGHPIVDVLEKINSIEGIDKIKALADVIDYRIHKKYKLWPDNYIAYDMRNKSDKFSDKYNSEEKNLFIKHMNKKLESISGDRDTLEQIFLNIYSNPVKNRLELTKPSFLD